MLDWISPISNLVTFLFTMIGAAGTMMWWLSGQFDSQRSFFLREMKLVQTAIMDKLEYHERHDDRRFAEVKDDIFGIQLRNAAIDGETFVARARARNKAIAEANVELMKDD